MRLGCNAVPTSRTQKAWNERPSGYPRELTAPTPFDGTNKPSRSPYEARLTVCTGKLNHFVCTEIGSSVTSIQNGGRVQNKGILWKCFRRLTQVIFASGGKTSRAISSLRGGSSLPQKFPPNDGTLKWLVVGPWPILSSISESPISVLNPIVDIAIILPSPSVDFFFVLPEWITSCISSCSSRIIKATPTDFFCTLYFFSNRENLWKFLLNYQQVRSFS